jgi:hypothetical protein
MIPQYQLRDDGLYEAAWPVWLSSLSMLLFSAGGVYRHWNEAPFRYGWLTVLLVVLFLVWRRGLRSRPVFCFTRDKLIVAPHFMRKAVVLELRQVRELSVRGSNGQRGLWSTDLRGAELRLDQSLPQELVAQIERFLMAEKSRIPVPIQIHEPSSPYLNQSSR